MKLILNKYKPIIIVEEEELKQFMSFLNFLQYKYELTTRFQMTKIIETKYKEVYSLFIRLKSEIRDVAITKILLQFANLFLGACNINMPITG